LLHVDADGLLCRKRFRLMIRTSGAVHSTICVTTSCFRLQAGQNQASPWG
jgi:hypothetical protein